MFYGLLETGSLFVCGGWKEWQGKKMKRERKGEIVSNHAPQPLTKSLTCYNLIFSKFHDMSIGKKTGPKRSIFSSCWSLNTRGREGYGRREKKGRDAGSLRWWEMEEKFKKASFRYLLLLIIQSKKRTQQRFLTSI